jgi:[acyl-carrier-protein] S-malonyltransferase
MQTRSRCAFLFPGQGAQFQGMALDLATLPEAKAVFDRGREVLSLDILAISRDGPAELLNSTRVSQPAIFLHSMAMLEVLAGRLAVPGRLGRGLPASAAAGLSLGEYSALVFAGALEFEDALQLVGKRGQYMQEACDRERGAMASILGLRAQRIEEVVAYAQAEGLRVGIANYNSPEQTVISGEEKAVAETITRLLAAGARRALPLRVAGAYHSPLMAPATLKLEPELRAAAIARPRLPFFSNCFGEEIQDPERIREGLIRQVESPVRWEQCLRALVPRGAGAALEVGPGRVLQGLARSIAPELRVEPLGSLEALDNLKVVPV